MGKASKASGKKKRSLAKKALLGKRDDADTMMMVDNAAPVALTGRQKHQEKVRAKRELRDAKNELKNERIKMPKRSIQRRDERKALTAALKDLKRNTPTTKVEAAAPEAEAAATEDPDDIAMTDDAKPKPKFTYAVDTKRQRQRERKRAKDRAAAVAA